MLHIQKFTFNPFQENTYLVYDEQSKEGILVDPGCFTPEESQLLIGTIEGKDIQLLSISNTHCHLDHVFGVCYLQDYFKIPFHAHALEEYNLSDEVVSRAQMYGLPAYDAPKIDSYLSEDDQVKIGGHSLEIRFVPGHSPGHIVFVDHTHNVCINGDVLFRGSIGRTDLPGGNHDELLQGIRSKMFTLPDDMVVHAGHGPETTTGYERQHNPFF